MQQFKNGIHFYRNHSRTQNVDEWIEQEKTVILLADSLKLVFFVCAVLKFFLICFPAHRLKNVKKTGSQPRRTTDLENWSTKKYVFYFETKWFGLQLNDLVTVRQRDNQQRALRAAKHFVVCKQSVVQKWNLGRLSDMRGGCVIEWLMSLNHRIL